MKFIIDLPKKSEMRFFEICEESLLVGKSPHKLSIVANFTITIHEENFRVFFISKKNLKIN